MVTRVCWAQRGGLPWFLGTAASSISPLPPPPGPWALRPAPSPHCYSEGTPLNIPGARGPSKAPPAQKPKARGINKSGLPSAMSPQKSAKDSSVLRNEGRVARPPPTSSRILKYQLHARRSPQCWGFPSKPEILPTAAILNDLRHPLTHPLRASVSASCRPSLSARKAPGVPKMASLQAGPGKLLPAQAGVNGLASAVALPLMSCDGQCLSFLIYKVSIMTTATKLTESLQESTS